MPASLTERQNQTLEFIRSFMRRNRRPPTLQEIADALGVRSTNAVHKLLRALEQRGYLQREQHTARGLTLTDRSGDPYALEEAPSLLLVSRTASDEPERLRARPSGFVVVDPFFLRGVHDAERCLAGRAGDDGMNGDGIRKGDFLIVEEMPWQDLRPGDTAAFLVRDQFLARRFFFANGRIHLQPADRTYTEETFPPGSSACHVVGRVVGVMRRL